MNREELVQKILDKMENIFDNDIALSEQIADISKCHQQYEASV